MENIEFIEAKAFTLLDLELENYISNFTNLNDLLNGSDDIEESDKEEMYTAIDQIAYELALSPQFLVQYVCEKVDSELHKAILMNEDQEQAGVEFVINVLFKDRSNLVKDFANGAAYGFNPLGKFIRDQIHGAVADSPIYLELRGAYQTFGMDLVLGVIDELLNQGTSEEEILAALNEYQNELLDSLSQVDDVYEQLKATPELFENIVKEYWDKGIVSGDDQSKEAKVGEVVGGVGGAVVGAKIGAVLGSIIPGPGTIAGAAIGGALGNIFGKTFGLETGVEYKNNKTESTPE